MKSFVWVILGLCLAAVLADRKRYDGYQVLEVIVTNQQQKSVLDILHDDLEMDFWTETPMFGYPIQVMVPPHRVAGVISLISDAGITYTVARQNVQERLDVELERLRHKKAFDLHDYNTLEDIEAELYAMAARCPAGDGIICEVYSIGQSTEGRELLVLKVSKAGSGRGAYWFDSTIHAREWLATATNLYVADHITRNYGSDSEVTELLDSYDFYFLAVMNPDGYQYTWDSERMWRKSRNTNANSNCIGVDLNRNYDYKWGNAGSSSNPCSDTYMGPVPASEPETQLVQDEGKRLSGIMTSWTSIHTSGNMWMHPWGWNDDNNQCARADDHQDLYDVAEKTAEAIMATHNTRWTYGSVCETIYAASGGTLDYMKGGAGIKYTFTPELRGGGFDPPPSEIVPSFEEVWNGILAMVAEIESIAARPPVL